MPAYTPLKDRLLARVTVSPTGCWLWDGPTQKDGYGILAGGRDAPGQTLAHRCSYVAFKGKIPRGREVDHDCKVRLCVNPKHLIARTHAANVARGDYTSNHRNRRKTHCARGHELSGENLRSYVLNASGKTIRQCRTCDVLREGRRRP